MTDKPELLTTEYKPWFSLLAACLGQITLAEGVLWTMLALFAGQETALLLQPGMILASGSAGFLANHLLLRRDRSLLVMILLNLVLAAAGCWILAAGSVAAMVCISIGLALGLFSLLRWEIGRFRDETMMLQMQILLVIGAWELWFAGQIAVSSAWISVTFVIAVLQLAGILVSKVSGLNSAVSRRGNFLQKVGPAAGLAGVCALVFAGALILTEPFGQAVSSGYAAAEGLLQTMLAAVASVIIFLFRGKKIRADVSAEGGGSGEEFLEMEEMAGAGEGLDLFLLMFYGAVGAVFLMLLVMLLRTLFQIAVRTGRRPVRKAAGWTESDGTALERIRSFFRELRQRIHAWKLLRQNPSSVAALLVFLEAKCARSEQFRRRPGETVRGFLCRLADSAEAQQPGMRDVLLGMADAADRACYSREGDLLLPLEESEAIRSFFRENP